MKQEISFIENNKTNPLPEIALALSKHPELDKTFIISQINGLQKAKKKLPEFYKNTDIIYPATISIEQCSSEQTALFKANLVKGKTAVDLTGGFGIDSYYFSKQFNNVTYLEPNASLFETVTQNFKSLGATNILCENTTTEDFLKTNTNQFDLAYIDPSRRNENQKVFMLADCIPNIIDLKEVILKIADKILIKTSPILDIKQSIKELKNVSEIWVVSLNNECKEVLYLTDQKRNLNPTINAINIGNPTQQFSFDYETEENCNNQYSEPLSYIYEPNSSILKAGAFKSVAKKYKLKKLATNTHLYTSEELVANFPGRSFKINDVSPYQAKVFKKKGIKKANITCRNFSDSVEQVKKKLNLTDGGSDYIFATTDLNNKPILVSCVKE